MYKNIEYLLDEKINLNDLLEDYYNNIINDKLKIQIMLNISEYMPIKSNNEMTEEGLINDYDLLNYNLEDFLKSINDENIKNFYKGFKDILRKEENFVISLINKSIDEK